MIDVLKAMFEQLDAWITNENKRRVEDGGFHFPKGEVLILGQMSLLANSRISAILSLVGTIDIDAHLKQFDYPVKQKMLELFKDKGFVYDEDSEKIWLPPDHKFETIFKLKNLSVSILDPESALVSKAIKAKEKNRVLIQDAIASEQFPNLVDRIEANGGDLDYFTE